jgi:hypothetical protein
MRENLMEHPMIEPDALPKRSDLFPRDSFRNVEAFELENLDELIDDALPACRDNFTAKTNVWRPYDNSIGWTNLR